MDYLVVEGYKEAAQNFSLEAGLTPQVDLESIHNRKTIRRAIQRGDVEDAIGRVNELDPEVRTISDRKGRTEDNLDKEDKVSCTTLSPLGRCGYPITPIANFLSESRGTGGKEDGQIEEEEALSSISSTRC